MDSGVVSGAWGRWGELWGGRSTHNLQLKGKERAGTKPKSAKARKAKVRLCVTRNEQGRRKRTEESEVRYGDVRK